MNPFDAAGQFQIPGEGAGAPRRTVRNAGVTIFGQGCVFIIQMLGMTVLARILTPGDFGLVTMVTTFSLLFASFGVAGISDAILQRPTFNHSLATNLFWINLGGGFIVAALFAAAGRLMAAFYGDPRITRVAIGFAVAIFLAIAPVVHLSLVRRGLRFGIVSVNDVIARVIYVATAIVCGYFGWGYWALVAAAIVQPASILVGALILCRWRPGLPSRVEGTGKMVKFAIDVYGRFSINYGTGNLDNLLVGWRFGATTLGFYKKAFDLFVLPSCQLIAPVVSVIVTALSRKNKDHEEFKRYFMKALCIVAFVGMAASADLTLVSHDLVRILMGPAWGESGRIFMYFAPGIGLMLIYQTTAWVHLSLGTTRRWLGWSVFELAVTAALFAIGLHWGPAGIAGAWTTSFFVLMVPGFYYAGHPIGLRVVTIIAAVWRYMVASLAAGFATAAIVGTIHWLPLVAPAGLAGAMLRMIVNSAVFALLYLVAVVLLYGGFAPLIELAQLVPDLVPGFGALRKLRPAAQPVVRTATFETK